MATIEAVTLTVKRRLWFRPAVYAVLVLSWLAEAVSTRLAARIYIDGGVWIARHGIRVQAG